MAGKKRARRMELGSIMPSKRAADPEKVSPKPTVKKASKKASKKKLSKKASQKKTVKNANG